MSLQITGKLLRDYLRYEYLYLSRQFARRKAKRRFLSICDYL